MAKGRTPKQDVAKIHPSAGVPDFLRDHMESDTTIADMAEYRVLPRFKVIQSTSASELLKVFDAGDLILSPGNAMVSKVNKKEQVSEPFLFVPVFFFVEFCKWSDLKDTESPVIMVRSFDPSSEVAKFSRDPNKRFEKYKEDSYVARYAEHLNFAGFIYGEHGLSMETAVMGFSRGEFTNGRNFISAISIRKAPLWSQVWSFQTGFRERGADRKWWGVDFSTDEDTSFITDDEVEFFKEQHAELKDLHAKAKLVVDHSDSSARDDDEEAETDF